MVRTSNEKKDYEMQLRNKVGLLLCDYLQSHVGSSVQLQYSNGLITNKLNPDNLPYYVKTSYLTVCKHRAIYDGVSILLPRPVNLLEQLENNILSDKKFMASRNNFEQGLEAAIAQATPVSNSLLPVMEAADSVLKALGDPKVQDDVAFELANDSHQNRLAMRAAPKGDRPAYMAAIQANDVKAATIGVGHRYNELAAELNNQALAR